MLIFIAKFETNRDKSYPHFLIRITYTEVRMTPMTNLTFTDSMVGQLKTKTIYTTHDISRLLQVNPRSVINWIEQNLLPSYRTPGGHRRVRRDDLLAFLRKHQIPTPASLVEGKFRI